MRRVRRPYSGGPTLYPVVIFTVSQFVSGCIIILFVSYPARLDAALGAGGEAVARLIGRVASPHTRAAYVGALHRLGASLDGRPLDDRNLAAHLRTLQRAGRAPATAALVVSAVRRAARGAGERAPDGPLTQRALQGFRRRAAATGRRSLARGLTAEECDAVLATCRLPRRVGSRVEREEAARRRGLVDGAIVALLFHGALRCSEVAALRWADIDLSDGDQIVVTLRRSRTNPLGEWASVRHLVGGCAAAVRRLHAAMSPAPGDSVIGLSVYQINRRFAAACVAAGLEGRRTTHSGRAGLAMELSARGASTREVQLAGGWKDATMVARYAASVSSKGGAVSRLMQRRVDRKSDG